MWNKVIIMGFTEEKLQTDKYTCPNCGGACEFDPKKQMLTCQYCNSKIEIDKQIFNQEQDIETLFKEAKVWDETEIIQCQNCGAKESVNKVGYPQVVHSVEQLILLKLLKLLV